MATQKESLEKLRIAIYPWFAIGHIGSFLPLAKKLAQNGHHVYFFIPSKTLSKLSLQNQYPDHLTFIPITVPLVDGLPAGAETTNDVPDSHVGFLLHAMDQTRDSIETRLTQLKPHIVFYEFAYWIPELGLKHGFKSVFYALSSMASLAYFAPNLKEGKRSSIDELVAPPPGFPTQTFRMHIEEAKGVTKICENADNLGLGITMPQRFFIAFRDCDAIAVKTCMEMEKVYIEYVEKVFGKPVLLGGPMIPNPSSSKLDEEIDEWLNGFEEGSVVYCALGSEVVLHIDQFHELVLGLELTGRPFLAAIRPPKNHNKVESALPEGFIERTKGKGMIKGGWVQQQQILRHPSVGCFITHCGLGSLSEAIMISDCQVVLMPQAFEQFINAKMMSLELKIGIEVEKGENDKLFTKQAIQTTVSLAMDQDSQIGKEVRNNHAKLKEILLKDGLEDSYIATFIQSLRDLL
ncbi:cyanidin 3-O-galactoside 2''-O-xylosyltransferase FGGT1-like [Amaranthus tricolor]|uniref:cyanidin 3-O-galactoside 2''-O-xylosyltransferase FGGT1-like n=1 Tax=Amaranthus tricolor TaxID=29722 RepID=UPI00258C854A|nr:cyanidin 3-O-galactoside 2''-O-xylosyltransferase FGGT1-like [Amaranthus tricolor]